MNLNIRVFVFFNNLQTVKLLDQRKIQPIFIPSAEGRSQGKARVPFECHHEC